MSDNKKILDQVKNAVFPKKSNGKNLKINNNFDNLSNEKKKKIVIGLKIMQKKLLKKL